MGHVNLIWVICQVSALASSHMTIILGISYCNLSQSKDNHVSLGILGIVLLDSHKINDK